MQSKLLLFGATSKVYIEFDGNINELINILNASLEINLYIETDMNPPHEEFGMAECLGFEIWLYQSHHFDTADYELSFATSDCFLETFEERMYDISLWFAKIISKVAKLKLFVIYDNIVYSVENGNFNFLKHSDFIF